MGAQTAEQSGTGHAVAHHGDVVDVHGGIAGDGNGAALAGEVVAAGLMVAGLQNVEGGVGNAVLPVDDGDDAHAGLVGGDVRAGDAVLVILAVDAGLRHDQRILVLGQQGLGLILLRAVVAGGQGDDLQDHRALIGAGGLGHGDAVHRHDDAVAVRGHIGDALLDGKAVGIGGGLLDEDLLAASLLDRCLAAGLAGCHGGGAEGEEHGEHDQRAQQSFGCLHYVPP